MMEMHKILEFVKSKDSFFLFIYYAVILTVSIFLVFDYWNPIPIQSNDYIDFQKTITKPVKYTTGIMNSTEKETITTNGTMKVIIKEIVDFYPENQTKTVIRNETGEILNDINHNFALANNSKIHREFQLILLSLLFGVIGSTVHALSSLINYVGTTRYNHNWFLWYLGRPVIGGIIALIFYVIIRGGILSVNAQPGDLNYFGIAAISVIAGLLATEGTQKIRDIFSTLFGTTANREKGEEIIQEAKQQIQQAEEKIDKVEEKIKEKGEQETEQGKEKFK